MSYIHQKKLQLLKRNLENNLRSLNFREIEVDGDGNCLFRSIITYLILNSQHPAYSILARIHGSPVTVSNIREVIRSLRKAVVGEWTGQNSEMYQMYLSAQQLQAVAAQYLEMGEFAGDIGDLILPALRTLLNILNLPVIVQQPLAGFTFHDQPIFLGFDQSGPGHYSVCSTKQRF